MILSRPLGSRPKVALPRGQPDSVEAKWFDVADALSDDLFSAKPITPFWHATAPDAYSTVTLFARLRGLSTSVPRMTAV